MSLKAPENTCHINRTFLMAIVLLLEHDFFLDSLFLLTVD